MVIEKILKQLTPERVKREVEAIKKVKLPPELQKWVKEYNKVGERDEFLWKWIFKTTSMITSPAVDKKYRKVLPMVKAVLFMFDTLLDDIADKTRDKTFLNELIKIPFDSNCIAFNHLKPAKRKYLLFTKRVWNYLERAVRKLPRYKEFQDLFKYDILQLLNTMRYSCLINMNPHLINKLEFWAYLPPNMTVMICSTIDLMCSPRLKIRETGKIREIFWLAQEMTRIGNWVSTWEREINENDFTSGIWPYALDQGIINIEEIKKEKKEEIIKKIKKRKIEKTLLSKWEKNYIEISKLGREITSFDVNKLLLMLEGSVCMHLCSRGYK